MTATLALSLNLFVEVYLGHAGKHVARMAGSGAGASHWDEVALLAGLAMCVVVTVLVSRSARRAVQQAVAREEGGGR